MKNTLLTFLTLISIIFGVNAQNVNIPDANFKAYLVGNASINTNGDTEIQVSEASAFSGAIHCANLSIADLTGIESFTALTQLYCFTNSLNNLDVSNNTNLTHLNFSENSISNINVSNNTNLTLLVCEDNTLSSLDISNNAVLEGVYFNNNSITSLNVANNTSLAWISGTNNLLGSLDLSNNTVLEEVNLNDNQLTYLNVSNGNNVSIIDFVSGNNPSLTCIEVDDVAYSAANWTNIDPASSFSTNCPPPPCTVTIPDANFKAYLVGNAAINTNGDTEIQCSEASAFSGTINCVNLSISDLTGIEAFMDLTGLQCSYNQLTSIDISNCIDLVSLLCANNQLSSLDVSNNIFLTDFRCESNSLTSLDVSQNPDLTILHCDNNSLSNLDIMNNASLESFKCNNNTISSLDVSNNLVLETLRCNFNSLTALDASNNSNLITLVCSNNDLTELNVANGNNANIGAGGAIGFVSTSNPNLACIQVDDVAYSNTNWTDIDPASSFSTNCSGPVLVSSIDVQGQGGVSTITTQGGTLQMEATVLPANADDATYTWSVMNGSGTASIDANGLLTAIADGAVTVIANANDASGVAGTATITVSNQSVGIAETSLNTIQIYPNPVQNQLFIETEKEAINKISILDLSGKVIQSYVNLNSKSIDVSILKEGVYFLKTYSENSVSTIRFIKNNL